MPRTAGGEWAGANCRRKNVSVGREAPRQTRKQQQQQQQQQQRGVDAKGSRRCGSVAKETRGSKGRKAKESPGVGAFWNRAARAHPSMVCVEEEGARDVFRPRAEPSAARQRPWRTTSSLPVWWRHSITWRPAGPRLKSENSSWTSFFLINLCNFSFMCFTCVSMQGQLNIPRIVSYYSDFKMIQINDLPSFIDGITLK